jgi:hypothetical protein
VDSSARSLIQQALRHQPSTAHTAPPSGREPLAHLDMLKAAAIGGLAGLVLRAGLDLAAGGTGLIALGGLGAAHDPRAATLMRLWILGGVLVTLGSGALTAVVVRRHQALWVLVSMACVALPLLLP